ncbi:MAG: glucose-1-phosphate thymidylyltransferase RfbA [Helicobacteraceae bacterium]|jgi:glucose-1-phosphate thymidylyltransferase|nr:glucose-1-phosphate thymidylyltransferase RfbA [Helicobacteraceae bacterium]
MKGIILAGGSGTRLYPVTKVISKQLLPVYDKPMIYYPLSTLMFFGIREILIISTPKDTPIVKELLGDGSQFGLSLSYMAQPSPDGLAQAFILGETFIGDEPCALVLGDNIFHISRIRDMAAQVANSGDLAVIFAQRVVDPHRFGVLEFDQSGVVVSIEEKPSNPKSNYASVGLYFFPPDVARKAKTLKPSARGEIEITELINLYIKEQRLKAIVLGRGSTWIDAGTPDSLMEASQFVQIVEKRQGIKIACLEEIAFKRALIDADGLKALIGRLKQGAYREYLEQLLDEREPIV